MTVLAYPKFRLTADDIEVLLADYLPFGRSIHPVPTQENAPRCRDSHDQPFVDLVLAGQADYLVTGDKDLLAMNGCLPCPVITPATLREILASNRDA
jgi:putative PIN family toxin of toxin-antitoxin system